MMVDVNCQICKCTFKLDFGEYSKEEALKLIDRMDPIHRECPGRHVELGGWKRAWQLEDAVHRAYDLGEGVDVKVETDEEYIRKLQAEGRDMVDGGQNTCPELNLKSIHDYKVEHYGMGEFGNSEYDFIRYDSPSGTRFYQRMNLKEENCDVTENCNSCRVSCDDRNKYK